MSDDAAVTAIARPAGWDLVRAAYSGDRAVFAGTKRQPACWGVDPELFFGPADSAVGGQVLPWEQRALQVCAGCSVAAACLAASLEFPANEQHGVIGGLTAGQRRALLRASRQRPTRSSAADTVTRDRRRLMQAAVQLHQTGHGPRSIATRLEVGERRVQRWLAAHRTRPLAAADQGGRSGKVPKLPPEGVA